MTFILHFPIVIPCLRERMVAYFNVYTNRAYKTLIRYTKNRAPKIDSDVYCINHRKKLLHLLKLKSLSEKRLLYIPNKQHVLYAY